MTISKPWRVWAFHRAGGWKAYAGNYATRAAAAAARNKYKPSVAVPYIQADEAKPTHTPIVRGVLLQPPPLRFRPRPRPAFRGHPQPVREGHRVEIAVEGGGGERCTVQPQRHRQING